MQFWKLQFVDEKGLLIKISVAPEGIYVGLGSVAKSSGFAILVSF
jgi:hypothetical protein